MSGGWFGVCEVCLQIGQWHPSKCSCRRGLQGRVSEECEVLIFSYLGSVAQGKRVMRCNALKVLLVGDPTTAQGKSEMLRLSRTRVARSAFGRRPFGRNVLEYMLSFLVGHC